MMNLCDKKIEVNQENDSINVSFRMSKSLYDTIKTSKMVEDFGLSVLAGIENQINGIKPDSPDLGKVKIEEKI